MNDEMKNANATILKTLNLHRKRKTITYHTKLMAMKFTKHIVHSTKIGKTTI